MDDDLEKTYKKEYLEEHGVKPNEDQIEEYKDTYYSEIQKDKQVEENNLYTIQAHETNEILEVGDDYGEMPQGTESYGDGLPEVTDEHVISV